MAYGLSDNAVKKINAVFAKHSGIEKAELYGSRAKGNYKEASDIDLVLYGKITFPELLRIESELDELLLPWSIDLSIYKQIDNPALREHIQRVGAIFYEAPISQN
jgi:predicted nucleotidyltransferase